MTDCRCHAGKICDLHVEEVMDNLNDRLKDRKNYHDSEEGLMSPNSIDDIEYLDVHVKMEGKKVGKIVGKFIPESKDKLSDEEMEIDMKGLHDVWNTVGGIQGGVVGGYLGDPIPVNVLPDLHGEIVKLCLRVKELEDGRKSNLNLIENITKRLNEAERKLDAIEEQFLHFIELRKIKGTG